MKKAVDRHVSHEQTLMLVLAIVLCLGALWAIGLRSMNSNWPENYYLL